jgi:hypothetical protein
VSNEYDYPVRLCSCVQRPGAAGVSWVPDRYTGLTREAYTLDLPGSSIVYGRSLTLSAASLLW